MAGSLSMSIGLALCLLSTALVLSTVYAGGDQFYDSADMGWMIPMGSGLVGDVEPEFELDSDSNRRILATTRYISYGALQRNTVPCSRRGQSYYNCRPGAPANPYTRGCSAITRCRS